MLKRAKILQKSDEMMFGRKVGIIMTSIARRLNISVPAVSKSTIRGAKLAKAGKYSLAG